VTGGFCSAPFSAERPAVVGATDRSDLHLPDRQERDRRIFVRRAGGWRKRWPRLSRRRLQLSAVSATGADLSVLARQPRSGAVRVPLATFVAATALGVIPATFAFAVVGAGLAA